MPAADQKNSWTAPMFDFRGVMMENADDRRYQQRALEKVRFVPYLCRSNQERPQHLRTQASHRRIPSGRQSGRRAPSKSAGRSTGTVAASGGGGDDGGDDGPGDPPPPTPELLALVDDIADLAADLYLSRAQGGKADS